MKFKRASILFIAFIALASCSVSSPDTAPCIPEPGKINTCIPTTPNSDDPFIEADPDNPAYPPRGEKLNTDWEAMTEQCEWQPETEWCKIECTTERAKKRSWCEND